MAIQSPARSFEDRNYFPAFANLPGDNDWDMDYLVEHPQHSGMLVNSKHWCLLGEITDIIMFIRPRLVVQDLDGKKFPIAYHPDDENDMPRILKDFKVGNTIAILYAFSHAFRDFTVGVRVEESEHVAILPLALQDFLAMNRELIAYTPKDSQPRKCHGCDEVKEGMNKCGGCQLFYYCSKECQAKAWSEKEHKKYCKVLRLDNVKKMQFMDYGNFEKGISFK